MILRNCMVCRFSKPKTFHLRQEDEEGDMVMKRVKVLFGLLVAALILAGCATTGTNMHDGMVKCPMCGHEFNMPNDPEP